MKKMLSKSLSRLASFSKSLAVCRENDDSRAKSCSAFIPIWHEVGGHFQLGVVDGLDQVVLLAMIECVKRQVQSCCVDNLDV